MQGEFFPCTHLGISRPSCRAQTYMYIRTCTTMHVHVRTCINMHVHAKTCTYVLHVYFDRQCREHHNIMHTALGNNQTLLTVEPYLLVSNSRSRSLCNDCILHLTAQLELGLGLGLGLGARSCEGWSRG